MKKSKILILYSKNPEEVFNRKSALGSYIQCLSLLLNDSFEIYLNGKACDNSSEVPQGNTKISKVKKIISPFIPKTFKSLSYKNAVSKNNELIVEYILEKNSINFDLIVEFYSVWSNSGLRISRKLNVPLVTILDAPTYDEYLYFHKKNIYSRDILKFEKQALQGSTAVVTYNLPVENYAKRLLLPSTTKFYRHQNIDFTRYNKSISHKTFNEINLCFIGSFLKWHKVEMLIKAFDQIAGNHPEYHLYLIGSGMEIEKCKTIANNSHHREKIHFTGFIDGLELKSIKEKMHVGIMPGSNWYGVPNKIFEYGISGMSVVAPNTPAISDVFGNSTGVHIFEENNLESLLECIKASVAEILMEGMPEKISNDFERKYNPKNTSQFYSNLFKNVLENTDTI